MTKSDLNFISMAHYAAFRGWLSWHVSFILIHMQHWVFHLDLTVI
jgi:hypothetical protein